MRPTNSKFAVKECKSVARSLLTTILASPSFRGLVDGIVLPPRSEQATTVASIQLFCQALSADWCVASDVLAKNRGEHSHNKSAYFFVEPS